MAELRAMRAVKAGAEDQILERAGVTGVDIGEKYTKGKPTGEMAIRVYVAEKKPKSKVGKAEMIPDEIDGIPTDVIERTFELHPARMAVEDIVVHADTGTYDPVKGGISIGPCRAIGGYVFTGTLGCVVTDNATGDPLLLSNFHVMCVDDAWSVGDDMAQPSRVDTGSCPGDVVGQLQRAVLSENVDGAVSSLSGRGWECTIHEIGAIAGTTAATVNMAVRKRGRTTGLTHGTVDSIDLTVSIDYEDGLGVRVLRNQIGIVPDTAQNDRFGNSGDSGSVVVDGSNNVVGLYFAGATDGSLGIANPIAAVLSELDVSMCTTKTGKEFPKIEKIEFKEWKERFKEVFKEKEFRKELIKEDLKHEVEVKRFEGPPGKIIVEGPDPKLTDTKLVENKLTEVPPMERPPVFGGGRSVEERIAAIEQALGLGGGYGVQSTGCIDFRSMGVGSVANPLMLSDAVFTTFDHTGASNPTNNIVNWGSWVGLNASFRTEIRLRGCEKVTITLVHFVQPAKVEAYSGGTLVDAQVTGPAQDVAHTLTFHSPGAPIDALVVFADQDETLIIEVCCDGGGKDECKDCKDAKEKDKEKEKEKEILKELRDRNPKELKDRVDGPHKRFPEIPGKGIVEVPDLPGGMYRQAGAKAPSTEFKAVKETDKWIGEGPGKPIVKEIFPDKDHHKELKDRIKEIKEKEKELDKELKDRKDFVEGPGGGGGWVPPVGTTPKPDKDTKDGKDKEADKELKDRKDFVEVPGGHFIQGAYRPDLGKGALSHEH